MRKIITLFFVLIISISIVGCTKEEDKVAPNGVACNVVEKFPKDLSSIKDSYVEESYFDNTVFAGDSRVGIFWNYANVFPNTHLVWINSLTLSRINVTKLDPGYTRLDYTNEDAPTLYQYLMDHDFENYYILIGINELGMGSFDQWIVDYESFINDLKAAHPDRNIIIILEYDIENMLKSNTTPEQVDEKLDNVNSMLLDMAKRTDVYYINIDDAVCDSEGNILPELTVDGVHLSKAGGQAVIEYLKAHAITGELYAKNVCE